MILGFFVDLFSIYLWICSMSMKILILLTSRSPYCFCTFSGIPQPSSSLRVVGTWVAIFAIT